MECIMYSVIVPVYNAEKVLSRCIESILNQTISNFELILVDDGSIDDSGHICNEYKEKDKRIKVIQKQNTGVSEARNAGLNIARGKYIVFVDGDDYVMPEYLENLSMNTYDLVISGKTVQIIGGEEIKNCYNKKKYENIEHTSFIELFETNLLNACYAKRFRRDIIVENGLCFNKELKVVEDTLFVVEYILYCKNVEVTDKADYYYVRYGENTSLSSQSMDIDLIMMVEKANELIYQKIVELSGSCSETIMNVRMGQFYNVVFGDLIKRDEEISYYFIRKLFQQKWFRSTLSCADEVYAIEGKKFCSILKLKFPFIFWVFLCLIRKKN